MKNNKRYIVKNENGFLCKDKKMRSFINFGTPSFTCKIFKSEGWTRRAIKKLGFKQWEIIVLHEGDSIDASGIVTRKRHVRDTLTIKRTLEN